MKLISTIVIGILLLTSPGIAYSKIEHNRFVKSNSIVKKHHRISRNSAVKVITKNGHGSGTYIIIYQKAYVLTAAHVVEDCSVVAIRAGKEVVVGEIIFNSMSQDISLIKIPRLKFKKPRELIDPGQNKLEIGEELVYSGYPASYNLLTSGAQISGTRKNAYILQGFAWPGSSGSGAIGKKGKIVGVVYAIGIQRKQLIETLVYMEPITIKTWKEINEALKLSHKSK
tara:strand:+ start:78 stop:758 length:681 start_codon:yes stop_codon:yes gene_type:complete